MACRYREEIVGKRFLSVSSGATVKFSKITDWEWRAGVVRAASHKDPKHPELTVLVEFDDTDWKNREWIRVYLDDVFCVFLVENTLVWAVRKDGSTRNSIFWPSLTFKSLIDKGGVAECRLKPIEYLVDRQLGFLEYTDLCSYEEEETENHPVCRGFPEIRKALKEWAEFQDSQRILMTTPSVLVGYRVEVYRSEGTTQWYTAVIISYNDSTRELTVTDDTVLEEHNEDPCLVQMKLIGDGVVESILKGENIGITPRRRACSNYQTNSTHYSTRTRAQQQHSVSSHSYLSSNSRLSNSTTTTVARKSRSRAAAAAEHSTSAASVPDKGSGHTHHHQEVSSRSDRRRRNTESGDVAHVTTSRKRGSRQKRVVVVISKGPEDTDSAEDDECNRKRSRLSGEQNTARGQGHHKQSNQHADSKVLQAENEVSSKSSSGKAHKGVVGTKEKNKSVSSVQQETVVPATQQSATCADTSAIDTPTTVATVSTDLNDGSKGNSSEHDSCGVIDTVKPLTISTAVNSVSVVLTPLSPSIVSAAVSSKQTPVCEASTSSASEKTDDNKSSDSDEKQTDSAVKSPICQKTETEETITTVSEVTSESVASVTATQESCQRNLVINSSKSILDSVESSVEHSTDSTISEIVSNTAFIDKAAFNDNVDNFVKSCNSVIVSKENDSETCTETVTSVDNSVSHITSPVKEELKFICEKQDFVNVDSDKQLSVVADKEREVAVSSCNVKTECDTVHLKQKTENKSRKSKLESRDINSTISQKSQGHLHKLDNRNVIVSAGQHSSSSAKSVAVSTIKNTGNVSSVRSHDVIHGNNDSHSSVYPSRISQLDKNERSSDKPRSIAGSFRHHQAAPVDYKTHSPRSSETVPVDYKTHSPRSSTETVAIDYKTHSPRLSESAPIDYKTHSPRISETAPADYKTHSPRSSSEAVPVDYKTHSPRSISETIPVDYKTHQRSSESVAVNYKTHSPRLPSETATVDYKIHNQRSSDSVGSKDYLARSKTEDKRSSSNYHVDRHETVRVYRDPHLVNSSQGVRHVDCLQHSLMHPAGISHSAAAAAAAAAVYPRVANLPQHSRAPGAPLPPSPLGPYGLSSHLLPPSHVPAATAAAAAPPGSHMDQHAAAMHSQAYRHLLSQHPLLPPQYGNAPGPHVGLDIMWQQKYSPNPWVMAQYEEMRLGHERAIAQERERERNRIERDRREDIEREKMEREREKAEKDRQDRERMQKEQQQQQQRHERERLDREERERAQREVQQHFEESLRLHLQKQQQMQQKSMGWSPMSSLPLGKTQAGVGRSSPTVSVPQGSHSQSIHPSEHEREKVRDKEKERLSVVDARMRHEHERWLAAVQQQRNEQVSGLPQSHPQSYSSVEHRSSSQPKQEMYSLPRSSPHAAPSMGHSSEKSNISPSPNSVPGNPSSSQHKSETSFSLYGYQPFQHTYITHAQLKAREETKGGSNSNMQSIIVPSGKQRPSGIIKHEKDMSYERPPTPGSSRTGTPSSHGTPGKHQLKLMHQGQERSSPVYQPFAGSGGAFKPYEYSNNSPAPPAHQNTSPTMISRLGAHFHHSQQDQPQNLVKGDLKGCHDQAALSLQNHQRYDSRDSRQPSGTPPSSTPSSYTPPYTVAKSASPAANSSYSYSLIQQGLVPNPLYIAATHTNSNAVNTTVTTSPQAPSKPSQSASPISQHFPRVPPGPGITSGTPICRSSSVPYGVPQMHVSHSYSPVGGPGCNQNVSSNSGRTVGPQEAHSGSRTHISVPVSNQRSPSPAHAYASAPGSLAPNSPLHSRSSSSSSPRINTTPNPSHMQSMHRIPVHSASNSMPVSPPRHTPPPPDSQILPLNLQESSSYTKRKSGKDFSSKKRHKTNEEHLLPPQLHPQIHPPSSPPVRQLGTPPHLVSNSALRSISPHISTGSHMLASPVSEYSPSHALGRSETSTPPSAMPDLINSSGSQIPVSYNPTGFLDSYRSFVASQDYHSYIGKHMKGQKFHGDNQNTTEVTADPLPGSTSNNSSTISNAQMAPTLNVGNQESTEEGRLAVSPALSASSTVTSGSSAAGGSINHTKLKKAWLQRHSENEDKKVPIETQKTDSPVKTVSNESSSETDGNSLLVRPPSASSPVDVKEGKIKSNASDSSSVNGSEMKTSKAEGSVEDDSTSSASEMEQEVKHSKRKTRISRKQGSSTPTGSKRQKLMNSVDTVTEESVSKKDKDSRKKGVNMEKETAVSSKRRGRKTKGRTVIVEDLEKKKSPKPPEKPSIAQLKKTGEPFLQDGPCCDVAPRLPKCRECRMTPHQRSKKMPNIFCRFYAYRKLRYGKNGTILGAGFSEPTDATDDDLKLWLPPVEFPPSDFEVETSKFLLTHLGDQFCDLVEMEKEAQTIHMSENVTISWKRVVQGVREMCDVCETTLFNIHWVCHKCGFVVCIDCYKARKNGLIKGDDSPSKDRDEYQWLFCTNRQVHEQEKLMLTQIIASTALWDVGKMLHEVRRKWNIPTYCNCASKDAESDGKHPTNGICKLMSAVTKCFSSDKESNQVNGLNESPRHSKKTGKGSSVNGVVKQEDGMSGYSSESGGSPLSWLADVALNSNKVKDEKKKKIKHEEEDDEEEKSSNQVDSYDGYPESDDDKNENFSTLRELLIRPTGKMGGKNSGTNSSTQKTLTSTLDEVISCVIEQRVRKSDKKCKEKQLLHFTRRHQMLRSGRELLPIRSCMLTESSLLYPEVPHVWLGCGKILLLKDPRHSGNMQMFQEQWKRGQPVVVAEVGKMLNTSLWSPESFLRDFGDVKNDFLNCQCGTLVQNQPMKKFWEGFENISKRMRDEDGNYMVLKLKDWPTSEDFSELLPERYQDLTKVLPLQQYTHRDGIFNMASRLPDCFVRPDLGPTMYNAYGLASCTKGTTNLHLDISDSVNVLAYVGIADSGSDAELDVQKTLDESGCDSLMKKRSKDKNNKIGAIWHIYNARDADKIRDLLNKVAEEQGAKRDPHYDPIHNQEWYLDEELRNRLFKEYGVEAYVIVQCLGDSIFIPAGSPHQVRNINSCIKVSEDFVSPESIGLSFFLTQEIRNLSENFASQDDKLQIKNIIYHAVKDSLALLQSCDPDDSKS